MTKTIYYILGTPQSGRKELVYDLVKTGLAETSKALVLLPSTESHPNPLLNSLPNTQIQSWELRETTIVAEALNDDWDTLFFISEGTANPVDQIEAFSLWLKPYPWKLTRVFTVLDCHLVHNQPPLLPWVHACVHFSDVVFLNFQNKAQPKGFKEFLKILQQKYPPCLFETLHKGCVHNPARVLYPEARRLSHLFDDLDPIDTLDINEEELPEGSFVLEVALDPYLERLPSGQRRLPIPDINDYLS